MDIVNMIENFDKLPPLIQLIVILLWFIVPPAYAQRRIRVESEANRKKIEAETDAKVRLEKQIDEQRVRLETLELQHIKAESDAKREEKASANTEKLIEVIAGSNDRFQKVIDTKSERQFEADKMQHETNKMFLVAVERQTGVMDNVREMFEIQSRHYSTLIEAVNSIKPDMATTHKDMLKLAEENRHDVTTALELSVSSRTASDNNLRALKDSFSGLRTEVLNIISRREEAQNQTLQGIEAKFQSIEANISALINPRPVTLGDTIPLPTPETWDEDAEVTANIPPRKLEDSDSNPTPNPHTD